MPTKISIITATYRAPQLLRRAIDSMLSQRNPNWEMIISPDDGDNYSALEQLDSRICVVPSTEIRTGPGKARNRGLAMATGDYVGVLDDDDSLSPDYVGEVLSAMQLHGTVSVPTHYVNEVGQTIRSVGAGMEQLNIRDFGKELGSMHVICRRSMHPYWQACFAEDVLHTCEAIDRAGGSIFVVSTAAYYCTVRAASTCANKPDIDSEYQKLTKYLPVTLSPGGTQATKELFELRRKVNLLFEARDDIGLDYHRFINELHSSSCS